MLRNFKLFFCLFVIIQGCQPLSKTKARNFPDIIPSIGPYSHMYETKDFVFLSGQIAIDPKGTLVSDDIEEQTRYIFENIGKTLNRVNLDYSDIVKVTVYVTDISKFGAVNKVYAAFFEKDYPVRTTVGVQNLPKNAKIEIDVICAK